MESRTKKQKRKAVVANKKRTKENKTNYTATTNKLSSITTATTTVNNNNFIISQFLSLNSNIFDIYQPFKKIIYTGCIINHLHTYFKYFISN